MLTPQTLVFQKKYFERQEVLIIQIIPTKNLKPICTYCGTMLVFEANKVTTS